MKTLSPLPKILPAKTIHEAAVREEWRRLQELLLERSDEGAASLAGRAYWFINEDRFSSTLRPAFEDLKGDVLTYCQSNNLLDLPQPGESVKVCCGKCRSFGVFASTYDAIIANWSLNGCANCRQAPMSQGGR